MRPIRPLFAARRGRSVRRTSSVLAVSAALALTATACGPGEDNADGKPTASATTDGGGSTGGSGGGDKIEIPDDIKDRLKEHGIDVDKWRNGEWKNWDKDKWLREAEDFVNPIIEEYWDPDRLRDTDKTPEKPVDNDISGDQGKTDPTPAPVDAEEIAAPYHGSSPATGKLVFETPEGSAQCSATVVKDPANPGKSNMVWTAGHCVHAGKSGGWYRNIAFVPSYNDEGKTAQQLEAEKPTREEIAPYGIWWSDWTKTSDQWIATGANTGGAGAPYDFAVMHMAPEKGGSKSLEETVGAALPVEFNAPAVPKIDSIKATGYPAAPPFQGQEQFSCADKPGRLSLSASQPTMYRIGCTMTGGSSGGGWVATGQDGKPALVSNTSIGPATAGWLAGPRFGKEAKAIYDQVSEKFAN
ncbi:trypsin-like serine peptidase [Streptomyces sp. Da 82-17]|uniref:trypsin-like serine peptidase n=1 Tax=Streptomyces sp. Da 82-17 TaxID=3377116 RepID=UPI0038D3AD9E